MSTLGTTIRERRFAKGFGLRQLGRELSISPSYLRDIEAGNRVPSTPMLQRIGEKLELDVVDLHYLGHRVPPVVEEVALSSRTIAQSTAELLEAAKGFTTQEQWHDLINQAHTLNIGGIA